MNRSNRSLPFSSFTAFGLSFFRYRTVPTDRTNFKWVMRLTLLAFIVAEISLPGHCNSDCTFLLQKSTPGTRPQLQLSQPLRSNKWKLSMGMLGLLKFHVSFTKSGTPTSFQTTRLNWQQLGSWRIQNVNINCGTTQRLQSFAARNLRIWFGQFGKHFH